jgi:hypothetical protein
MDSEDDPDACILWPLAVDADGYGTTRRHGRTYRAHRLAYEELVGPIPTGLVLRHTCDVPACINVRHLIPGTVAENNADARERGRAKPPPRRKRP